MGRAKGGIHKIEMGGFDQAFGRNRGGKDYLRMTWKQIIENILKDDDFGAISEALRRAALPDTQEEQVGQLLEIMVEGERTYEQDDLDYLASTLERRLKTGGDQAIINVFLAQQISKEAISPFLKVAYQLDYDEKLFASMTNKQVLPHILAAIAADERGGMHALYSGLSQHIEKSDEKQIDALWQVVAAGIKCQPHNHLTYRPLLAKMTARIQTPDTKPNEMARIAQVAMAYDVTEQVEASDDARGIQGLMDTFTRNIQTKISFNRERNPALAREYRQALISGFGNAIASNETGNTAQDLVETCVYDAIEEAQAIVDQAFYALDLDMTAQDSDYVNDQIALAYERPRTGLQRENALITTTEAVMRQTLTKHILDHIVNPRHIPRAHILANYGHETRWDDEDIEEVIDGVITQALREGKNFDISSTDELVLNMDSFHEQMRNLLKG